MFHTKDTVIRPNWKVVAPLVGVGLGALVLWMIFEKVMYWVQKKFDLTQTHELQSSAG